MTKFERLNPTARAMVTDLYITSIRGRMSIESMHTGAFTLACWEYSRRHFPAGGIGPDDLAAALCELAAADTQAAAA